MAGYHKYRYIQLKPVKFESGSNISMSTMILKHVILPSFWWIMPFDEDCLLSVM